MTNDGDESFAPAELAEVWPKHFIDLYRGVYAPMVRLAHLLGGTDAASAARTQPTLGIRTALPCQPSKRQRP